MTWAVRTIALALVARMLLVTSPAHAQATADSAAQVAARADSAGREQSAAGYARALALWTEAASLATRAGRPGDAGRAMTRAGTMFRALGQPDSALAYFRRALPLRLGSGDQRGVSATLTNTGLAYADMGRLDSALAYYGRALRTSRAVANGVGQAIALQNMGVAYAALGRGDSARVYYDQAVPLWRAEGNAVGEAGALANVGVLYMAVGAGRGDSALAYFGRALPIFEAAGDRYWRAVTLTNVGTVHERAHRPDSALAYYQAALPLWRALGNAPGTGATLRNVGDVLRDAGAGDSALAAYDAARRVQRDATDRLGEAATLESLGYLYLQPGRLGRADPARAVAYFDTATAAYAAIRAHAGGDANAIGVAEDQQDAYSGLALGWLARREEVGAGASAASALGAVERGRAQALLALLRAPALRAPAPAPAPAPVAASDSGATLEVEATRLLAPLRARHAAALTYLVTRDTLVVWLLSAQGDLHVARAPVARDTLAALVGRLRRGLESSGASPRPVDAAAASAYADAQRDLDRLLVPPALRPYLPQSGELVVIPHGALTAVPFGVLSMGAGPAPVGVRYAVRYAPSLAALAAWELPKGNAASRGDRRRVPALVVGDPAASAVPDVSGGVPTQLARLPGARAEARAVAGPLGVRPLLGAEATESAVRARLPHARVVHLAAHAAVFAAAPRARDSFVALAPDSASDGLLTAGEVLDDPALALSADLVVLSACRTGLGPVALGEGVVGLQRAFLARGARAVLASLWNVSDQATALLMRRFYAHWLGDGDGPTAAEALRRAQADVRGTPGYAHPRYWAAFQLVGVS